MLRLLVTGSTGFLGGHVLAAAAAAGHHVVGVARRGGDIAGDLGAAGAVDAVMRQAKPDVVLNLAALARLAECEREPAAAHRVNAWLPQQFAARVGARLLHVSTDLVFDGHQAPYDETAPVAPLSQYGLGKAQGEEAVRAHGGRVARLPLLFGPDAAGRGATAALRAAAAKGEAVSLFTNEYRTPLHVVDAARALVHWVAQPDGPGVLHLAGPERVSRWEFARRFAAHHGLDHSRWLPVECRDPQRPRDVSLRGSWQPSRGLEAMLRDA